MAYQDRDTVQRWTSVGYQDGLNGRPKQTGLTYQVNYDDGYNAGDNHRKFFKRDVHSTE